MEILSCTRQYENQFYVLQPNLNAMIKLTISKYQIVKLLWLLELHVKYINSSCLKLQLICSVAIFSGRHEFIKREIINRWTQPKKSHLDQNSCLSLDDKWHRQDLSRKCSAWKDFGLWNKILVPSSSEIVLCLRWGLIEIKILGFRQEIL